MSSGTAIPTPPAEPKREPEADRYEALIHERLQQTRRQVKGVDIVVGFLVLAIGVLVYLAVAVVADHWLIGGGFGSWGRLLLLLGLLGGSGYYFARWLLPPLLRRINPVFAAHTIEQVRPTLKNSLINFLLLRRHREEVSGTVYQAVQQRAAADLSTVPIETTVDRAPIIRLGYLLTAVVAICCLYLVLSPKNPFVSVARVLWPWTHIAAPTRVNIEDVKPGDVVAFHGDTVTVSAEVTGAGEGEPVLLVYNTADRQRVDQVIPMSQPDDGYRYRGTLPPDNRGLQQDGTYFLTAGDCRARTYTIDVQTAPAIVVDQIEYDFPDYTGRDNLIVERQGDVRALEGTTVIVRAEANREIARAEIDLDCDGRRGLKMQTDGQRAHGRFVLRLHPDQPTLSAHDCYQIRFTDRNALANRRPIRHGIEVVRDLPPDVEIIEPQQTRVEVAEDGKLLIRVRAEDPDFALARLRLHAERDERELPIGPLLEQPHQGQFTADFQFEPARWGLKAGDRVLYWAEAEDNKAPDPGRTDTAQRQIIIVDSQMAQRLAQADRPEQQPREGTPDRASKPPRSDQRPDTTGQPPAAEPDKPGKDSSKEEPREAQPQQPGEESQDSASQTAEGGKQSPESAAEQARKPIDPDTQEGDAFEEILKHRGQQGEEQDKQEKSEDQSGGQSKSPSEEKGEDQSQPGAEGQPDGEAGKAGDGQSGGQSKSSSEGKGEDQSQKGAEGPPGEKSGKPTDGKSGDGDTGDQAPDKGDRPTGDVPREQAGSGQEGKSADHRRPEGSGGRQPEGKSESDGQMEAQPSGKADGESATGSDGESTERAEDAKGRESPSEHQGPPQQPGMPQPGTQGQPGESGRTPDAQGANQPRPKQPSADPSKGHSQSPKESPQSPSTSPKQSESKGETAGDRSGDGEEGGGMQTPRSGRGTGGSHAEDQHGASQSEQKGKGETGDRAGKDVETDRKTGSSERRPKGDGPGRPCPHPGCDASDGRPHGQHGSGKGGTPQQNPTAGGRPDGRTSQGPRAPGSGNPLAGGKGGPEPSGDQPPVRDEASGGSDPNLDYANKATDLALEHLRDQMKQPDSELLDRLGWSPKEAERFLERWRQLKRAAREQGPEGNAARQSLTEALKSLGLRPGGAELRGGAQSDQLHKRESTRYDAPGDWNQWLKAYTRGVAGDRE